MTTLHLIDDLSIRPRKPAPSPERITATFALPAFWRGATATRIILGEAGGGLQRCVAICAAVTAGLPLAEIEPYRDWLGPRK